MNIFKGHQPLHTTLPSSPTESIVVLPTPPPALRTASTDSQVDFPPLHSSALCHSRLSSCSIEVHFGFDARKVVIIKPSGDTTTRWPSHWVWPDCCWSYWPCLAIWGLWGAKEACASSQRGSLPAAAHQESLPICSLPGCCCPHSPTRQILRCLLCPPEGFAGGCLEG